MLEEDDNSQSGSWHAAQTASSQPIAPFLNWVVPLFHVQRLRYLSEGMSTLRGAEAVRGQRTLPVFEIINYQGPIEVIITCISSKAPFRLHPHQLTSKDTVCSRCARRRGNAEQCPANDGPCTFVGRCANGYFHDTMHTSILANALAGVGLQSVKRNKVQDSIKNVLEHEIDPFDFYHNNPNVNATNSHDMKHFRLCIQGYINYMGNPRFALQPLVSEVIKANDLVVRRICRCSASVLGGDEIMLYGANITKDVCVKFYEVDKATENVSWQVQVSPVDIYRSVGLCFKTPKYYSNQLKRNAQVYMCLVDDSDGAESEAIEFEYIPAPDTWIQRRNGEVSINDIITSIEYYLNVAQIADAHH